MPKKPSKKDSLLAPELDWGGLDEDELDDLVDEALIDANDMRESHGMAFECRTGEVSQAIDVLDLPLPDPAPEGARWIHAYRYWGYHL